jgi:hypothetical protein
LANPPHPLHQFFETYFVLQEPSYSSIFPIGQGLVLALGWTIFGHPWAGVALSIGALCALVYWMLRAWTTPGWALIGGLLAVIEFGPLNQWMNSYWGGAVSACAGCLVFGALPRLRESGRRRDAAWLGLGLALQLLTRPFESIFLVLSVLLFFLPDLRHLARPAAIAALVVTPAIGLMLLRVHFPAIRARALCHHRRTDRSRRGGRKTRRHLRLAHAQRGRCYHSRHRRSHPYRP